MEHEHYIMRLTKILKQLQTKKKKNQNSKVCNFATYFSMRVGIFFLSFFFFKKTYLSMRVGLFFFKTQTKSPLQPTMCMLRTKWTLLSYLYTCKLLSWCMWHSSQSDMLHVHVKNTTMPSKKMSGALWRSP